MVGFMTQDMAGDVVESGESEERVWGEAVVSSKDAREDAGGV